VNCGPWSILLHCYYRLPFTRFIYILANYYLLPLDTFNPLFTANWIDNLTVSWGKVLGCVVCRFHVAAGAKLRPRRGTIYKLSGVVAKLASINLQKLVLSPTSSINLGFILREDLLLCSSYLPLGVANWADMYTPSIFLSGKVPRRASGPSRSRVDDSGGLQYVFWKRVWAPRVFPSRGLNRRKGDVRGWTWRSHPWCARLRASPRHHRVWMAPGPSPALLWTPSSCQVIRDFSFCFVKF
jgi:hypothetical protein